MAQVRTMASRVFKTPQELVGFMKAQKIDMVVDSRPFANSKNTLMNKNELMPGLMGSGISYYGPRISGFESNPKLCMVSETGGRL